MTIQIITLLCIVILATYQFIRGVMALKKSMKMRIGYVTNAKLLVAKINFPLVLFVCKEVDLSDLQILSFPIT